jgi:hypothetical protein
LFSFDLSLPLPPLPSLASLTFVSHSLLLSLSLSLLPRYFLVLFFFLSYLLFYVLLMILFIYLTGQVTTLAGSSNGFQDGIGFDAKMNNPIGMCLNPHDNCLYVSDHDNNKIRKVTMNGIFYPHFSFLIQVLFSITKHSHTNSGEVSSVEVKGDLIHHPRGIAIYHKDQSLFVTCERAVMKITSSGLLICFSLLFSFSSS